MFYVFVFIFVIDHWAIINDQIIDPLILIPSIFREKKGQYILMCSHVYIHEYN